MAKRLGTYLIVFLGFALLAGALGLVITGMAPIAQ